MKRIMVALGVVFGLGLVGVAALDGLARVKNAAAMESAARAVQIQATAGAVNTLGLMVVIVLLAGLVVGLLALVVVMGRKVGAGAGNPGGTYPQPLPKGRGEWTPGPNARWGKRLPPSTGSGYGQDRITVEEMARALMIARMLDSQAGPTPLLNGEVEDPDAWEGLFK